VTRTDFGVTGPDEIGVFKLSGPPQHRDTSCLVGMKGTRMRPHGLLQVGCISATSLVYSNISECLLTLVALSFLAIGAMIEAIVEAVA
jgi:hypothetical protein